VCIEATQTIQGVPYTVYLHIRVVHTTNQYEAHHTPIPGHTNITGLFTARANSNRICGARSEQRKGGEDKEKGVKMGNFQFFWGGGGGEDGREYAKLTLCGSVCVSAE
jgi:hypothetical protein